MKEFYLYAVQVNVALLVFYLLYQVLFSRDTFLEIRRLFLMTVIVLAFTYPAITFSSFESGEQPLQEVMAGYYEALTVAASVVSPVEEAPLFTWQNVVMLVWMSGVVFFMVRMLVQFGVVCRMAVRGEKVYCCGQQVVALRHETAPFSFFGWIFVNPDRHEEKELSEIMTHEITHMRQWHSVDMMMGELLCIFFWFNPLVWLLRKEIRQNLEFLADKYVVSSGYNRKNYQYHLLRLSHQTTAVQIVNNFNVSPLKKRIIMMNKKRTSRIGLVKYALLVPMTGLLILSANAKAVAEIAEKTITHIATGDKDLQMKGKVVDENGKPIPGVSVIIKNSYVGGMTDAKGNFVIRDHDAGILCFSFVGMKSREVPYEQGTKELKVVMYKDNLQLDRVVVTGYSTVTAAPEKKKEESMEVFVVVEDMPQFPDGMMQKFLARNVKYPVRAMENGVEGTVYVTFVVDKTGKVTNPRVVQGVDEALDREAVRVINAMPDWIPGKQRGMAVDVQFTIPIEFNLVRDDRKSENSGAAARSSSGSAQPRYGSNVSPLVHTSTSPRTQPDDSATVSNRLTDAKSLAKSEVMYIVDGEEMAKDFKLNSIPVDQVKSITVLKDKAAIAIYGEKAKNGVVVIETMD